MPKEDRESATLFLPFIMYEVSKDNITASRQHCTIKLNGSKSLLEHEPVSFQVPLQCEPQPQPNTIKIIREMYKPGSDFAPIVEGLSGNCGDCSEILLHVGDVNCCTLLCEISFHLYRWEDLGRNLRMKEQDIQVIKRQYQSRLFESAFQMLIKWATRTPSLGMLIEGLRSIGTTLELSSWSVTCTIRQKTMDEVFFAKLVKSIPICHWEFVARLLGESESAISGRSECDVYEQAYQMLWQWKRQHIECIETYTELVKAVHCVKQHTGDCTLDELL